MKTTEEVITEFRKKFLMKGSECTWEIYPEPDAIEQFIREALEQQEKEIYILHKTLDEVLSLSMMYIGRDKIYEIFDFAFKELKKGWIKGLPVTMTFAEHWKLKTNKPEEKECLCHCHLDLASGGIDCKCIKYCKHCKKM